jgi:oligopeptide/dipeptide ABC transporter ATP-binding protein
MYLGRIVEESSAATFFRSPRHPYSELLLQSMPVLHSNVSGRPEPAGDIPSIMNPPPGCAFHPRCPKALPSCPLELPSLHHLKSGEKVACFLYT